MRTGPPRESDDRTSRRISASGSSARTSERPLLCTPSPAKAGRARTHRDNLHQHSLDAYLKARLPISENRKETIGDSTRRPTCRRLEHAARESTKAASALPLALPCSTGGWHERAWRILVRDGAVVLRALRGLRLLHDRAERARAGHDVRARAAAGGRTTRRRPDRRGPAAGRARALRLPASARRRPGLLLEVALADRAQGLDRDQHGVDRLRPRGARPPITAGRCSRPSRRTSSTSG